MSRSPMRSQQHPWHSATKRQIMGAWRDGPSTAHSDVDGSNPDHVKILLEDLQTKYDQIVANLRADLADHKMQQEEAHNVGLMKLPKSTRQMTVNEFNQSNGCDILAILLSKDGVKASKKRDYQMAVAATPAPRSQKAPESLLRTARKGEGLYSSNGSPVEAHEVGSVIATVTKKRRGNNDTANFEINVGDGRVISLSDPSGLQALDSSMKATAASQLKVLQDQMASLMAQLTN